MKVDLNGDWLFREAEKGEWKNAVVPGCNYLDLLRLGQIPDPFVGTNEKDVYWVACTDWEYQKEFDCSAELLSCDRIDLECLSLDTICDVYLNGQCIGHGENAHLKYIFSVKPYLQEHNCLRILFHSPVNFVKEKQAVEKCPRNNNGQDGIPHIRKPQCHFGWDWGPVLPPSGISDAIAVVGYNSAKIADVLIAQTHSESEVFLNIHTAFDFLSDTAQLQCRVCVLSPEKQMLFEETNPLKPGDFAENVVTIKNPQLWWTRDLSDAQIQPLYTVTVALLAGNSTVLDVTEKKIGLRTIELNRERDEYGENFQFKINGVPLFIKGANWIPADSFRNRYTEERLEYDLQAVKFSNMNMLRVWGGGYYESDAFYEKCDRDGILIWQDFCFACQPYPFFDEALLENVRKEVEYNVKRLRHHASLALWNGNNEIETMSIAWRTRLNYMDWTEKFFYHILPEWMQSLDAQTPYIPGSPCGTAYMKGYDRDNVGDTHLWAVWHGLQPLTYYRQRMTRFCSEFGFESLPDLKTIETYATPKDYSLTSEVFAAHQKCNSGNMKMAYYITSRFRLPKHFEDYIYLSQICQEECVRDATEHWRRNRGRCNGSMYWQLNDCWPVCSWASMDYYGNYKALQYCAHHFNAPITLSLEDTKESVRIYTINDTTKSLADCCVQYRLLDFNGKVLTAGDCNPVVLGALESRCVETLRISDLRKCGNLQACVLVAELISKNEVISQKTLLFAPEKELRLPKTNVQMQVKVEKNQAVLTLESTSYVRFLQIYSKSNTQPFSDNYFDLLPGEEKVITQTVPNGTTAEDLQNDITFFGAGDIVPNGSRLSDFITKAKVFLQPMNFGSYVYDHRIPPDLKLK
ncbi:MAG: glycosyl hydrolase 2 galactose-binding domain-containing protein [Candidatus Fimenecus sp.]